MKMRPLITLYTGFTPQLVVFPIQILVKKLFNSLVSLLLLVTSILLLSGCNKDSGSGNFNPEVYRDQYEAFQVLQQAQNLLVNYSQQGDHPRLALLKTLADIRQDSRVDDAWHIDSLYLYMDMKTGLRTVVSLVPKDANNHPLTRGGGGGGQLKALLSNGNCANEMKNKKVLVYVPELEFQPTRASKKILDKAVEEEVIDKWDEIRGSDCYYESLKKFKDYGLVMINTHGLPNGFMLDSYKGPTGDKAKSLQDFARKLYEEQNAQELAAIQSGQLGMALLVLFKDEPGYVMTKDAGTSHYFVTGKGLSQLPKLHSTIVMGNMCYSGYESTLGIRPDDIPIKKAMDLLEPIAYYGYQTSFKTSYRLADPTAKANEFYFYNSLFTQKDSTGFAHLNPDGTERYDTLSYLVTPSLFSRDGKLYWRLFGAQNYCYGGCGTFTDPRDGEEYQLACIGDQEWFAENLRWAGNGLCFQNDPNYCTDEGRLYSVYEALNRKTSTGGDTIQGICPQGWHIPSKQEIDELIDFCGGKSAALTKLRAPGYWPNATGLTNAFGFDLRAVGRGYYVQGNGPFFDLTDPQASLWTSTGYLNVNDPSLGLVDKYYVMEVIDFSGNGNYELRIMDYANDQQDQSYALRHCRCVKDK